jgi:hypothetical protein
VVTNTSEPFCAEEALKKYERAPRALSPRTAGPTPPPNTAGAGRSDGLVSRIPTSHGRHGWIIPAESGAARRRRAAPTASRGDAALLNIGQPQLPTFRLMSQGIAQMRAGSDDEDFEKNSGGEEEEH